MGDFNQDKIAELAQQLGLGKVGTDKLKSIENAANQFKGKNDEQIMAEMKKLKETVFKDKKKLESQVSAMKGIREVLNPEQKKKFDQIIDLLMND